MNELEIIQHPQIRGLNMFFNTMDYRTPHFHEEWEILLPLEHSLTLTCNMVPRRVQPGEMIVINPRELHEYNADQDSCTFLCLQLSEELFPRLRGVSVDAFFVHPYIESSSENASYQEIRELFLDIMHSYLTQEPYYEMYCIGQVNLLLFSLLTHMPCHQMTAEEISQREKRNTRLDRLMRFVDENFQNKIRLQDFARQEGLSMNYLSGFIRQTMNQTFQEYVSSMRFHYACKRMSSGSEKLLTICMESGYSDYRYFSAAFRQRTGMTPEEYRQNQPHFAPSAAKTHHSMHSLERFYTREQSLRLWKRYQNYRFESNTPQQITGPAT